ncbi:hypothetical protein TRFO_23522 [Tritrichomonas foetus]|uniref:Uncharacterized protein n=1 Tax=Tritrichomonas foetus TaxID=1144522 RepID=A0A1J4K9H7_9EUKA|nr:hypothetical protein TRFO_23522 [Tritrichomonas foetus]|eukprot:OHT08079.1 hypothetical protein TRFO_23522 [Tritrichomonas foetus]
MLLRQSRMNEDESFSHPSDSAYENCLQSYLKEVKALKNENSQLRDQLTMNSVQHIHSISPIKTPKSKYSNRHHHSHQSISTNEKISSIERMNQSLSTQLKKIDYFDYDEYESHPKRATSDICDTLSKKFQSKSEQIKSLQAQLSASKKENRELRSKLTASQNNEQILKIKIQEMNSKCEALTEINDALKIQLSNYEESLPVYKTVSILEDEITKLKNSNSKLSKKVKILKESSNSFYENRSEADEELEKIRGILMVNYSNYSSRKSVSSQFQELMNQISSIAEKG